MFGVSSVVSNVVIISTEVSSKLEFKVDVSTLVSSLHPYSINEKSKSTKISFLIESPHLMISINP